MTTLSPEAEKKLNSAQIIWIASVRPADSDSQGRPHLVPVWFVWHAEKLFISIEPKSIKSRNIARNPQVVLALEDGLHPVICEGTAAPLAAPWPEGVIAGFKHKYDWDITTETQYNELIEITPQRWLAW